MSDLHLGYRKTGERCGRVVERLGALADGHAGDYVVVITGDLVHSGRESSYYQARGFVDGLRAAGFCVLAVPGNHDYRSGSDRLWRRQDEANVARFKREFCEDERDYPRLDIIPSGGGPDAIAFIGLDTMRENFRRRDAVFDRGEFGPRQLDRLREMLNRKEVKDCGRRTLYFHHHPFGDFPLPPPGGADAFREVIVGAMAAGVSIDALLYGHTHFGDARHGTWGIPRCYNAGTATAKPRFRVIDWLPVLRPRAATRCIRLDQPPESDLVIGWTEIDR